MDTKQFLHSGLKWGLILWFVGYVLGVVFFMVIPVWLIGWIITPIGVVVTFWVLLKKVPGVSMQDYALIGLTWLIIAVICDYIFLVQVLHVTGYYKLDVYLYYALTFVLPLLVGWRKLKTQLNYNLK